MVLVNFDDIYSRFYSKVEALDVVTLIEEDARDMMCEWLKSVKSHPKVRRLFSSINLNDTFSECTFTLKNPIDDDSDADFITELFAVGIAWKWSEPKYFSALNTMQFFGGKEEKFYSQANHMSALNELYLKGEENLIKTIRDYGYINNSYLRES